MVSFTQAGFTSCFGAYEKPTGRTRPVEDNSVTRSALHCVPHFDVRQNMTTRTAATIFATLVFTLSGASYAQVSVFACEWKRIDIPRAVVSPAPDTEEKEIGLDVYYVREKLGEVSFDDLRLSEIVDKALKEDKSDHPFFGPGYEYILRDAGGRFFTVFFEFKKDHKVLTGFRAAIAPLNDLGSKGTVFVGYPYAGVTFDKTLLATLKSITEKKLAEQGGTGQPATRPESKSEGDDKPQPEAEGRSR